MVERLRVEHVPQPPVLAVDPVHGELAIAGGRVNPPRQPAVAVTALLEPEESEFLKSCRRFRLHFVCKISNHNL
jgi:hypothetical protein